MTISYAGLVVRSERRVRLLFSGPLAVGAFGPGSVVGALYVLASTDGSGENPGIAAAIPMASAPSCVELALTTDLVAGGAYTVTTLGVPGTDATTSAQAIEPFVFGALPGPTMNIEQPQDDLGALVYGVDLIWTGSDFLETAAGDLATTSGLPNLQGAMKRRLLDRDGLPWDPTYGAKSDRFVNGPAPNGGSLVSSLRRQSVSDDRIQSATVTWVEDPTSPGDNYFPVVMIPRGATAGTQPITIDVNPPGTNS